VGRVDALVIVAEGVDPVEVPAGEPEPPISTLELATLEGVRQRQESLV
jgi:hypothetical protein